MALYQATTQQVEELTNTTGTGYPSIDRPWLSYYSKEAIEDPLPDMTLFEYLSSSNASTRPRRRSSHRACRRGTSSLS